MRRCTVSAVSTLWCWCTWCLFVCLNTRFPLWQTCCRTRRCTDPRCPSWPRAPQIPSQRQEAGSKIRSSPPCGWALKMDGEQIHPPPPSSPLPDVWVCVCVSGCPPPPPNPQPPSPMPLSSPDSVCFSLSLSLFSNFLSTTTLSFLSFFLLSLLSAPSTPPNPPPLTPYFVVVVWFDVLLVLENENTWQVIMKTHGKLSWEHMASYSVLLFIIGSLFHASSWSEYGFVCLSCCQEF